MHFGPANEKEKKKKKRKKESNQYFSNIIL